MKRTLLILLLMGMMVVSASAQSPSSPSFQLAGSIGSGAASMQSESFVVDAGAGSPSAGLARGEDYSLGASIWGGGPLPPPIRKIYLPLIQRLL